MLRTMMLVEGPTDAIGPSEGCADDGSAKDAGANDTDGKDADGKDTDGKDTGATVLAYHRASKHHPRRYAPGPRGLDWASQPDPFRTYVGATRTLLPLFADQLETTYASIRVGARPGARPSNLDTVSTLLELSLGLSAWKKQGSARWALRCNPSSGNLHPTEAYVLSPAFDPLPAGVHHYVSRDHALEHRALPRTEIAPVSDWDSMVQGGVVVMLTSIHWREAWKYGLRAFRYCQLDCGHAIAALAYSAAALGWQARLLTHSSGADLSSVLGLDPTVTGPDHARAEPESPEVALWVGPGAPPAHLRLGCLSHGLDFFGTPSVLSPSRVEWPGIQEVARATQRATQRAGVEGALASEDHGGERRDDSPIVAATSGTVDEAAPGRERAATTSDEASPGRERAATIIRQRRSGRDYDRESVMGRSEWLRLLASLLSSPHRPPLDAVPWPPRVHPVFFVHRVDGVRPGLYVLPRASGVIDSLRSAMRAKWAWTEVPDVPPALNLHLLIEADLEREAKAIACDQDIAADSCFSVALLADLSRAFRDAPWIYREVFWEAGMLGQIMYLEAEALGYRGTGIGCFFDDLMHELLGFVGESWHSVYHFTVGRPIEDPRVSTTRPYEQRL